MTPIVRAFADRAHRFMTCLLLAVSVLGGLAVLGAATATSTARTSVGPSIVPASGAARATGRPAATSTPVGTGEQTSSPAAAASGPTATFASSDRIALSAVLSSAQQSPLPQFASDLMGRELSGGSFSISPFLDGPDVVTAAEPSPAAARAPPRSA